ncbi:MAG TPA: protein kinase [Gemmatimonadales bacterium]
MPELLTRLQSALADRYRLDREIGAGGMATVYLAQDIRHDRKVALKVLRPELAAVIGAERFLAEIKLTANLQHPHILPLFDSGEADSYLFYVMPFIEGETLRDRLNREKQLPVGEAVQLAGEVASALDYAHRRGVVHRDIKPENILLHDGQALVADFGIALAASKAGGTRMTETGMSLGTPAYMSPEQAMGEREITARSDVYALGCMTYEMLVGDPPFTGSTAQAIVAKVLTAAPIAPTELRKTVPPSIEAAVLVALEKLAADRFASAAEFAAALAGGTAAHTHPRLARVAGVTAGPWRRVSAILGGLTLALIGILAWALTRHGESAGPSVFDAALPDVGAMTFAATTAATAYGTPLRNIGISPGGDFAVYAAKQGDSTLLWYRSLRDATAHPIAGTRGATVPRVSPDGARIAFLVGGQVMVIPVDGGEPRRLLDGHSPTSLAWISRTTLLVNDIDGNRLSWLDPEAGLQRSIKILRCFSGDWISEDGQLLCTINGAAYVEAPETGTRWSVRVARPDGSAGGPLNGSAFRLVQGDYLVYVSPDGDLRAAPYDRKRHLAGRSVTLQSGVRREGAGDAQFDLSAEGTLVCAPGADATVGHLVRLSRGGAPVPFPIDSAAFQRFDLSRDGRWLAAVVQVSDGQELRIYDLRNGQRTMWMRDEVIRHALWTPAGDRLIVGVRDSTRWSILSGTPGSGAAPDTLFTSVGPFSPDPIDIPAGNFALAQDFGGFVALRFDPTASRPRLDTAATDAMFSSVSPDGRHFLSEASDERRVIVTSYPVAGRRWQVASDGVEPLWLSSTEVLYRSGVDWYLARLNPVTGEPMGAATFWARDPRFSDTSGWSNRPSHDGGIIYVQGPQQISASYLRVVPNWVARMKQAVDGANR